MEGNWGPTLTLDSWMNVYKVFFLSYGNMGKYFYLKKDNLDIRWMFCDLGVWLQQFFLDSVLTDQQVPV